MNTLNITQIQEILPHRSPFLMIDRVLDYEAGQWARAIKCVTMDEPFFAGHFPGQPIMPGVLILEALAQTGGIAVLVEPENRGKIALFGGVKAARFKTPVTPGDVLELECNITNRRNQVGFGQAVATVGGKIACRAELSFVVQSWDR